MSGISFSIKKTEASKVIKSQNADKDEEKKDYVLELEGKEIKSTLPRQGKKELIIKMIGKNNWRAPPSQSKDTGLNNDSKKKGSQRQTDKMEVKSSEEMQLEREAADAVIRDMCEAQAVASSGGSGEPVIPLLLQNQPPVVEGREKDELADVHLRPEQSTLVEYDCVPIESFGVAMLRGMGWEKGTAIGLTNKGLVEPIEFTGRIGRHGLGAIPRAPPPDKKRRIKKPGEEEKKRQGPYVGKDGRVKYYKKVGEEIPDQPLQGFVVGNYARVLKGPHKNLGGKIVRADENTGGVVLKMAINGQTLGFSQHHLELVSREESVRSTPDDHTQRGAESAGDGGTRYGLVSNKDRGPALHEPPLKRLKEGRESGSSHRPKTSARYSKTTSQDRSYPDHQHHSEETCRDGGRKEGGNDSRQLPREQSWLYPHLRVRMVDQRYGRGRYYNTKVVILDVISVGVCDCQTETGRLLEGVTQSMLETVVPRAVRSKVMIVGGAKRGQVASIMDQDRHKARAVVELSLSKEVLQVDFDNICEYTGTIDDDM